MFPVCGQFGRQNYEQKEVCIHMVLIYEILSKKTF